jgi:membrane protein YqaA with SNARE-associated domain
MVSSMVVTFCSGSILAGSTEPLIVVMFRSVLGSEVEWVLMEVVAGESFGPLVPQPLSVMATQLRQNKLNRIDESGRPDRESRRDLSRSGRGISTVA